MNPTRLINAVDFKIHAKDEQSYPRNQISCQLMPGIAI